MLLVLLVAGIFYLIIKLITIGYGRKNEKQEKKEKAPWIVRNAWWIAMFLAIWFIRMCSEMSTRGY